MRRGHTQRRKRIGGMAALAWCSVLASLLCAATPDERIVMLHSDVLRRDLFMEGDVQILTGNVQFSHKDVLMYCDSARFNDKRNSFDAYGNVRVVQGDSLTLTSDMMFYDGMTELTRSRHNVVLTHNSTVLYTDSLDYDRLTDLGYFFEGGRMIDGKNTLTSDWGEYSPTTKTAIFNYNVHLDNPNYTIDCDTMHYSTETEVSTLLGPSHIINGDNNVYTNKGYYFSKEEQAILLDRSRLVNKGREMVGDSMFYDDKEAWGEAFGNIVYQDTVNRNMFTGDYCFYNDSTGYFMATERAVAIDFSQIDTMWTHADTFKVYTFFMDTDSMYRKMHAFNHVRSYRRDLQSVCDSLVYNTQDSTMTMYQDPILWNENQQILGEEIVTFMNDSTIDSIQVKRQALTVERFDSIHFNQVASRVMHVYLDSGRVKETYAEGNVFVDYYPLDDDSLMIGLNYTETTEMRMYMEDRKLSRIWMPAATGTLYPIFLIPDDKRYLDNFAWFDYIRPVDRDDIFVWRAKKAGTELKASTLRQPPMQTLDKIKK